MEIKITWKNKKKNENILYDLYDMKEYIKDLIKAGYTKFTIKIKA